MKPAYYIGEYRGGKPFLWFFDGYTNHDLAERCRLQGLEVDGIPDWALGGTECFTLARMILTDAGGSPAYVNDMDTLFAQALNAGAGRRSFKMPLTTVHAWMVTYEPLRRQLRVLFGRDCPSCG